MVEVMVTRIAGAVSGKVAVIEVINGIENAAEGIGMEAWRNQAKDFNYFAP